MAGLPITLFLWSIIAFPAAAFLLEDGRIERCRIDAPVFATDFKNCSGQACSNEEAECVSEKCVCDHEYEGPAKLVCLSSRFDRCTVANDPSMRNFQGEFYDMPHPCRYRAAGYTFYYPERRAWTERSTVTVDGFNDLIEGKFFVGGFIARFRINRKNRDYIVLSFRGNGIFDPDTGYYNFERRIRLNSDQWTDFDDPNVDTDGVKFDFKVDKGMKRLTLKVEACGTEIYFRPANPTEGSDQYLMPGLVIAVDKVGGVSRWNDFDKYPCLSPVTRDSKTMGTIASEKSLPSTTIAAQDIAWLNTDQKNSKILPRICKETASTINGCSDVPRAEGFGKCLALLTNSIFVKCISSGDTSQVSILTLFRLCMLSFCTSDTSLCETVKSRADTQCGHRNLTELPILDYDCSLL